MELNNHQLFFVGFAQVGVGTGRAWGLADLLSHGLLYVSLEVWGVAEAGLGRPGPQG